MMDVIDALLKSVDGRRSLRVDQVRASIAQKMFGRIMTRVCELVQGIQQENDWGKIFMLIHDIRDVFVHSRIPAAVVHRDFGRLCAAVCDAMAIRDPSAWLAIPPRERKQAICELVCSVGEALKGLDAAFLGEWGERQLGLVVREMGA
jgi:hypothetical protein